MKIEMTANCTTQAHGARNNSGGLENQQCVIPKGTVFDAKDELGRCYIVGLENGCDVSISSDCAKEIP